MNGLTRSNALSRSIENVIAKLVLFLISSKSSLDISSPPPQPHRALICKWCCMGDAILSLYAIREFKKQNPKIKLDILVSSRIAEVYQNFPDIDTVYVLPITGHKLIFELFNPRLWVKFFSLIATLRALKYAQFIDLELYRSTGPILKWLLGIPYSRGFIVDGALPKNHSFETPRPRDMLEWHCFYKIFGLEIPIINPPPLFSRIEKKSWNEHALNLSRVPKKIGIVYGSSFNWPQKKWPWKYYAETISLLSHFGYEFVLFGTEAEKSESRLILAEASGNIKDTTGAFNFSELQKEILNCNLILGNDTGTLHLASACGVPTLTLFGPTDPQKWNGLTSTPLFLKNLACRPCYYLGSMPACTHFSCLRNLMPTDVAARIQTLLLDPFLEKKH